MIRSLNTVRRRTRHLRVMGRSVCARLFVAWVVGLCLVCVMSPMARAQSDGVVSREYPLKALFIYNFGSYVEWPASDAPGNEQPFVIGILGSTPIESTLHEIAAARRIQGRRIVIKNFTSPETLEPCQILFVPGSVSPQHRQAAVQRLANEDVLIVGESRGFCLQGAVVNFFIEANKIRFEINVDAAQRHHLKISSKLLALAKIIQAGRADGQ